MLSSKTNVLVAVLVLAGIGLILKELMLFGIILLFLGVGTGLADFRWQTSATQPRRLVAKGSPALLMVALMLAAAKGYVTTMDALLPAVAAQVSACPTDMSAARLIILRALEVLH